MISKYLPKVALLTALSAFATTASADNYLQRTEVREYLQTVSRDTGIDRNRLAGLFARLTPQQSILDAISRPAERTLTWRQYRPIFVTEKRTVQGREFIREHQALLQRAESEYGVPVNIIAAIIGVETFYGRITGKHGVLESLATLAFDYPPRSAFFKRELTEFLVLSEAEGWNAGERLGSYAGAMGVPQFISSSYREYAVDFDGDGKRDLFNNLADVIGSVANYLAVHGWVEGAPIAEPWSVEKSAVKDLLRDSLQPSVAREVVAARGFDSKGLSVGAADGRLLSVMNLSGEAGDESWVGYKNFYVITRYNHSRLYAMAVMQLAQSFDTPLE